MESGIRGDCGIEKKGVTYCGGWTEDKGYFGERNRGREVERLIKEV